MTDSQERRIEGLPVTGRLPATGRGVHNDTQAREAGLPAGAVVNELQFSHITELLMQEFGSRWLRDGEIEMKYVTPLRDGDTFRVNGRLRDDGGRVEVELWCENQRGERIAVGRASCTQDVGGR